MNRSILFIALVHFLFRLSAQEYASINFTMEDGLPSNTVYSVFQDSQGFAWVATENGLARFNGTDFKIIPGQNLRSLSMADINEDSNGNIWCINFSGQVLKVEQDTLRPLKDWDELQISGFPELITIGKYLYIIKQRRLFKYDPENQKLSEIDTKGDLVQSIPKGTKEIWCSFMDNSLTRLVADDDNREIEIKFQEAIDIPGRPAISSFGKDWIYLSHVTKKVINFDASDDQQNITELFEGINWSFRNVTPMNQNKVMFFGSNGIVTLDQSYKMNHLLPGENIGSATTLSEGGLLVGTLNKGLLLIPSTESKVLFDNQSQGFSKLAYDDLNDRIIAGDLGGNVHFLDTALNEIGSANQTSSTSSIQSLLVDKVAGRLFAQGVQFLEMDLSSMNLLDKKKIFTGKDIIRLDSNYYIATSYGLEERPLQLTDGLKNVYLMGTRMTSLLAVAGNELIIGSQKGTLIFDRMSKEMAYDKYPFQVYIQDLTCSINHQGFVILGSATAGIFFLDKDYQLIKNLTTDNGLISNQINAISAQKDHVVVATNRGLSLINLDSWDIINIDRSDGLYGNEISDVLMIKDQIVVASSALQTFSLPIKKSPVQPKIHVSSITIDGKHQMPIEKGYSIPFGAKEMVIHFDVSNNIQDLGRTKILYRLSQQRQIEWNESSLKSPQARYLSPQPGDYTLEAYAVSSDGIYSEVLSIPMMIAKPFWQKIWFVTLISTISLAIIATTIFLILRRSSRKKQSILIRKNKAQELRIAQLTSIRAQMNPHFIFNTMTMIQGLVLQGDPKSAGRTIQDFSKLMRSVLELSSEEFITLESELKIINRYLEIEKRRFDDQLQYSIELDEEIIPEVVRIPSLLTQPYVENALRHGLLHKEGNKELKINLHLVEEHLVIVIQDNGIGRKAAAELRAKQMGKSFALEAYQKRIDILNENNTKKIAYEIEDLTSSTGQSAGTRITLKIPLDYA